MSQALAQNTTSAVLAHKYSMTQDSKVNSLDHVYNYPISVNEKDKQVWLDDNKTGTTEPPSAQSSLEEATSSSTSIQLVIAAVFPPWDDQIVSSSSEDTEIDCSYGVHSELDVKTSEVEFQKTQVYTDDNPIAIRARIIDADCKFRHMCMLTDVEMNELHASCIESAVSPHRELSFIMHFAALKRRVLLDMANIDMDKNLRILCKECLIQLDLVVQLAYLRYKKPYTAVNQKCRSLSKLTRGMMNDSNREYIPTVCMMAENYIDMYQKYYPCSDETDRYVVYSHKNHIKVLNGLDPVTDADKTLVECTIQRVKDAIEFRSLPLSFH